jgi:hypothetical protein
MKIKLFFVALVALAAMSFTTMGPWELLGARKVNYAVDQDEIVVTRAEGVFSAIQLKVKRGPVNMHKLVIHYGNGEKEEIELRENFRAGSTSRVIDLPGNKRIIKRVSFLYDTKNLSNRKAVVELWGKH